MNQGNLLDPPYDPRGIVSRLTHDAFIKRENSPIYHSNTTWGNANPPNALCPHPIMLKQCLSVVAVD